MTNDEILEALESGVMTLQKTGKFVNEYVGRARSKSNLEYDSARIPTICPARHLMQNQWRQGRGLLSRVNELIQKKKLTSDYCHSYIGQHDRKL